MKLSLDPIAFVPRIVSVHSLALAAWYDSKPAVRRLWAVEDAHKLRVIVALEATADNNDVYPVWLANSASWAGELQEQTGVRVELELIQEFPFGGIEIGAESVIVADLFWRDATLIPPHTL